MEAPSNTRLQRTRRPRFRAGRSLRSLGEPRVVVVADRPVCDDVPEDSRQLYEAAVANAVLAKYCRRDREVNDLVAKVIEHLDSEQQRGLHEALALVVPLELPRGWRE